jgi:hypothetical protein
MIKDIIDRLAPEQKRQLMYAFEHEFAQYIELPNNHFVGVNVRPIQHLQILESAGDWSFGTIKKRVD